MHWCGTWFTYLFSNMMWPLTGRGDYHRASTHLGAIVFLSFTLGFWKIFPFLWIYQVYGAFFSEKLSLQCTLHSLTLRKQLELHDKQLASVNWELMMCDFLGTALVQAGPLEAHHLGPWHLWQVTLWSYSKTDLRDQLIKTLVANTSHQL